MNCNFSGISILEKEEEEEKEKRERKKKEEQEEERKKENVHADHIWEVWSFDFAARRWKNWGKSTLANPGIRISTFEASAIKSNSL